MFDPTADDHESAYELYQRGSALVAGRHFAQAAIVLERAARLEPGKGSILELLGRAYHNSAQRDRSAETFAALLEVDPSSHYAHYALGQSLKVLGRRREAWTHLRLALALSPESLLYRSALARMPVPEDAEPDSDPGPDAETGSAPRPDAEAGSDPGPSANARPD